MGKLFSLKMRIAVGSVLLVACTVAGLVLYMQHQMSRLNRAEQYKHARQLAESVQVSVENQFASILFHRDELLMARKAELQSVVNMAHELLQGYAKLVDTGELSESQARSLSRERLRHFRYRDEVGYVWVNDMTRPYARMVMHPTLPQLDGQILDSPEFDCALGRNENLFNAAVDVAERQGEGFVDYLWPKPTEEGLTPRQPKLSFVKRFSPWDWVVGSGLYVDDLENHVQRRLDEVLVELNKTFGRIKASESGYLFIFTGEREMLSHPLYEGKEVIRGLNNPVTGNNILDDLVAAVDAPDGRLDYIWDKPQQPGEFRFKKSAYVRYFEPLDWYIVSSFYLDEIDRPAVVAQQRTLLFSLLFMFLALVLSLGFAHAISRPLRELMTFLSGSGRHDYAARLPVERHDEFGRLAEHFNHFMAEIEDAHSRLATSEKRFRFLFEESNDARLIIDRDSFVDCNEAAVKMMRAENKEDLLNRHPAELSPEFQPDGTRSEDKANEIFAYAYERECSRFLWQHRRLDGEEFPVEVELTPIPHADRKLLHVMWRDMTRQKELEEQLLQSQKMEAVGTLAGGIAHDFNNILAALMGYVELAKMRQQNPEKLSYCLQEITDAAQRASDLVRQILAFSRKENRELQSLQLASVIEDTLKLLRASIPASIAFQLDLASDRQVLGDPTQVQQIIMNLCTNAYHAMREQGDGVLGVSLKELVITASDPALGVDLEPGHYLLLSISDTGCGMDSHTRAKIFEPYFTTKKTGKGTGLGLAVVHGIVASHGGRISVYSELGKGSIFHVYLPVFVGQSEQRSELPDGPVVPGQQRHILFVDDEVSITDAVGQFFAAHDYRVSCFNDPRQAYEAFLKQPQDFDLLISDMTMPGMNGAELACELLKCRPGLPVILCSGYNELIDRDRAQAMGIREYVDKPVQMSRLAALVQTLFEDET